MIIFGKYSRAKRPGHALVDLIQVLLDPCDDADAAVGGERQGISTGHSHALGAPVGHSALNAAAPRLRKSRGNMKWVANPTQS